MKPSPKEPETLAAAADQIEATINSVDVSDAERVELQMAANRFEKAALESSAAWKKDAMEKVEAEIAKIPEHDQTKKMDAGEYYDLGKLGALEWVRDEILTSTPTAESKGSEK